MSKSSVLCLPLGAIEQHGPHLPLNTDLIIADNIARLMAERLGDEFDLWLLPAIPVGLSREHAWTPGTLSLNVQSFAALLRDLSRISRARCRRAILSSSMAMAAIAAFSMR